MREITSRQNPLVAEYRAIARRRSPGSPSILLEGAHLVAEALAAGITITSAAVRRTALGHADVGVVLAELQRQGTEAVVVSDPVLEAMSPTPSPSGLIALAEITPVPLERAFARPPQLVIVLFDLQDPGNAGAVVRSAEALEATAVIFCGRSADPFGWKALRGSMGSAFRLPVVARADGDAAIRAARAAGLSVTAAVPSGGCDLLELDLAGPTAFLLGGEGPGLDPAVVAAADRQVSIPMTPRAESLNVAVAAALLAWEARRQRLARRKRGRHE